MENIGFFLNACEFYGCPKTDIFQTVDLYEAQNIPQVRWPTVYQWHEHVHVQSSVYKYNGVSVSAAVCIVASSR